MVAPVATYTAAYHVQDIDPGNVRGPTIILPEPERLPAELLAEPLGFVRFVDNISDKTPIGPAQRPEFDPIARYLFRVGECPAPYVGPHWWAPDIRRCSHDNLDETSVPTPDWVRQLIAAFDRYPYDYVLTAGEVRACILETGILDVYCK